jgi:hypothetical protein
MTAATRETAFDRVTWRAVQILFGIVAALIAIWRFWLVPTWAIDFKLTLQVAVDGEIKTGSGIIQTRWEDEWAVPIQIWTWGVTTRGEAIGVDLGSRGWLFLLLNAKSKPHSASIGSFSSLILTVFSNGEIIGPGNAPTSLVSAITNRRDVLNIPTELLPMLVRFGDMNDPTTVERVDPDDFARSFDPGVKLIEATIQIVPGGIWPFNAWGGGTPQWLFGAPVTMGIEDQLPWLRTLPEGPKINGTIKVDHDHPEQNLTLDNFIERFH